MSKNQESTSKHTPGPWEARAGEVYVLGGSTPIAHAGHTKRHDHSAEAVAERAANARLISAAPEMLEALRDWTDEDRPMTKEQVAAWYEHARALLARLAGGK
jgi:hypothetical protein